MSLLIEQITIRNFKSIRYRKLDGFRRINLFIGKPNVGKSNILEALSLHSVRFFNQESLLTNIIRIESLLEIFHEGNFKEPCVVISKKGNKYVTCSIKYRADQFEGELEYSKGYLEKKSSSDYGGVISDFKGVFQKDFNWIQSSDKGRGLHPVLLQIKRYAFKKGVKQNNLITNYLYPPFGANLLHVLEILPELRETIASWFEQYGLKLVLDRTNNSIRVQKEIGKNEVFSLPYSSIADTLQRIIFYKTAIASNTNSVLIFEEPEAHAYPPYIAEFTQEVIHSETNQFFMATHSPIVVDDFLTNAIDDLAIFMVDFKDGQTVVKGLSREEIHDVYKYGIDLFFNNEAYPVS